MSSQELHRVEVLARVKNRNFEAEGCGRAAEIEPSASEAALEAVPQGRSESTPTRQCGSSVKPSEAGEVPASGVGAGAQEIFR